MTWSDLVSVKKGNIGEQLVNEYLISKGFIPYSPDTDGAHPFDRLVASRDKKRIFIVDIKTKPARKYYPDTGINITHYNEYKSVQENHKLDVFIFFVDQDKKEIYGNMLSKLDEVCEVEHKGKKISYPLRHGEVIYFPLRRMLHVAKIPDDKVVLLEGLSARKQAYIP